MNWLLFLDISAVLVVAWFLLLVIVGLAHNISHSYPNRISINTGFTITGVLAIIYTIVRVVS